MPAPRPSSINDSVRVDKTPTDTTITWTDPPGFYNVYRGSNGAGPWAYNQICLSTSLSGTSAQDTDVPLPGQLFFYVVSRVDTCNESSLGTDSSGTDRPNPNACAIPPDADGDGIPDGVDNCVNVYNPDQADADNNGIGDVCEPSFFM